MNRNSVKIVESFWNEVWAGCNPEAVDRYVTEDFIITSGGVDITPRTAFKRWVAEFQARISGLEWDTIESFQNEDGSRVASRFRIRGRNNGMFGLAADQQPIDFTGTAIWEITPDGKLAHNWVERSAWELYQRLSATKPA